MKEHDDENVDTRDVVGMDCTCYGSLKDWRDSGLGTEKFDFFV
jgi:hypothetical protein